MDLGGWGRNGRKSLGEGREIKLRVGMQGEKSGFEGHLKSDLEI